MSRCLVSKVVWDGGCNTVTGISFALGSETWQFSDSGQMTKNLSLKVLFTKMCYGYKHPMFMEAYDKA